MQRKLILASIVAALSPLGVQAADLDISVTNLSGGIYFTPLLIAAHAPSTHLYQAGQAASPALQAMAEGGDIAALKTAVEAAGGQTVANPAGGLLAPAKSTKATLKTSAENTRLSVVAMMLPTNDGFIALGDLVIPTAPGTYTYNLNAHDAGTEANTELINLGAGGAPGVAGIPVDPTGKAGVGGSGVVPAAPNDAEPHVVHIHRGVIGDINPSGGASDLDSRNHRWLNPVASVTVVVK